MAEPSYSVEVEKAKNIVVVPQTSDNVSLQFGVLIGLIKVESVSNKECLSHLINLVSVVAIIQRRSTKFCTYLCTVKSSTSHVKNEKE